MPQVVFLSLFLGLITGVQSVDLQVDEAVKSVGIVLGGREVARMEKAPWSVKVDFGSALIPNELTAIAYDADGKEVARTSQLINLSRPPAEMEIVIRSEGRRPVEAQLYGRHRLHKTPTTAKLLLDGAVVRVDRDFRARLPAIDSSNPHIISAEMEFEDGEVAKRDVAIQPGFSGSTDSELTPLLVTSNVDKQPSSLDGCFATGGAPLRATAIETSDAFVVMVKDPETRVRPLPNSGLRLDADTAERILWPVPRPMNAPGEPTAIAFPQSVNHGKAPDTLWWLTQRLSPAPVKTEPRQYADAVAVAAMSTLERGRRRAVVLLLSKTPDRSLYTSATVRRYLEETGVPLFVWSADGPLPDQAGAWGQIDDISTAAGLEAAVARLNRALTQQRVVWVAADPLRALRAEGTERCGLIPVAHHGSLKPSS
ncbi:MAG TPA: hypothetical protein VNN08_14110 [Thermoanaerobaculia bacterium]|nr:hypothetical protein [Thermoanaerobaculia bacterium]